MGSGCSAIKTPESPHQHIANRVRKIEAIHKSERVSASGRSLGTERTEDGADSCAICISAFHRQEKLTMVRAPRAHASPRARHNLLPPRSCRAAIDSTKCA